MGAEYAKMPECVLYDPVGDVEPSLDLDGIPDDVREYARTRIGETDETKSLMVDELRELIYQRGDFEPLRMDDDYLLRFLRARNFKLEPSYKLLENYVHFRERNINYYEGVSPTDLSHIGDADVLNVFPYREQTGRRIITLKLGKWDPSTTPIDELFTATLAVLEAGILEPRAQILGGVCIFDLEGLSMTQAWNITPSTVSKVVEIMVTSFPYKISAIHILHESWVFEKIFTMFKPLLPARYKEICYFHGDDLSSLHKHIESKYLPTVYGGTRPEYSYEQWFISLTRDPKVVKEMQLLGYLTNGPYDPDEKKVADQAEGASN
uniref:Clavesin-1 n=2 Tax=Lygus hesperus TaxID=30085 RepID=A0A0A9VYR6_LYGHE